MKFFLTSIFIILISISDFAFNGVKTNNIEKIIPNDWQHWKSAGAQLDLKPESNGFLVNIIKAGENIHDIQVYSNNDLQIEKDKHYVLRFKARSNKQETSFIARLGSESEERNYFLRVIKIDNSNKAELKTISFDQTGDLVKFLKLYFELGQLDPGTTLEITDVEIAGE
jgi:hypothetical protein